jgi:hypothetical protein
LATDPGCLGANAVEGRFIPNDAPPELAVFAAPDFYAIYPFTDAASLDPN